MVQLPERAPDRLMDAQRVRVLDERGELEVERFAGPAAGREMTRQRQPRAPVLRVVVDQPPAEAREPLRRSGPDRQRLEPIEREVGAIRRDVNQLLPDRGGLALVALQHADVAEIQVGRDRPGVEVDRALESPDRFRDSPCGASPRGRFRSPETPESPRSAAWRRSSVSLASRWRVSNASDHWCCSSCSFCRLTSAYSFFGSSRSTSLNASSARSTNPPRL